MEKELAHDIALMEEADNLIRQLKNDRPNDAELLKKLQESKAIMPGDNHEERNG